MSNYIKGETIKKLRENIGLTQRELGERLSVSDKTVSKWETGRGLPDITMIDPLAKVFGTSVAELLSGEQVVNRNVSANMLRGCFYVCPICGNVIYSTGSGAFSCCGVNLPQLEAEEATEGHQIKVEQIEYDYHITMDHPMTKEHYISFFAYVTANKIQFMKLYPEQSAEGRFPIMDVGRLYAYCNKHGLVYVKTPKWR